MSTVSTLCATSTLGAAALGYAFGHQANPTYSTTAPAPQSHYIHDDTGLQARNSRHSSPLALSSRTPLCNSTPLASGSDTSNSYFTASSNPAWRNTVRAPLAGFRSQKLRLNGSPVTKSSPGPSPNQVDLSQSLQPGRLRRLSSVRLSSLSRPSTSESRLSRSSSSVLVLGNPFHSKLEQKPSPGRNKLVKRSLSVHYLSNSSPKSAEVDLNTALARPVTRHQCTKILRNNSLPPSADSPSDREKKPYPNFFYSDAAVDDTTPDLTDEEGPMPLKNRSAPLFDLNSSIYQLAPASREPLTLVHVKSIDPTGNAFICSVDEQLYTPLFEKVSVPTPTFAQSLTSPPELQQVKNGISSRRSFSVGESISNDYNQFKGETRRRRRGFSHNFLSRSSKKREGTTVASNMREADYHERDHEPDLQSFKVATSTDPATSTNLEFFTRNTGSMENSRLASPQSINPTQSRRTLPHEPSILHSTTSPSSDASGSSVKLKRISRPSRASVTPSERTSDSGTRVFDDDGELQSDTHFDSIRTALTSSSAGRQGVRLETLFDKDGSDVQPSGGQKYSPSTPGGKRPSNISEESESVVTPVRTDRANGHGSPHSNKRLYSPNLDGASDERLSPKPLSLGRLAWDIDGDEDPESWSADDERPMDTPRPFRTAEKSSSKSPKTPIRKPKFISPDMSPSLGPEQDKKNNLFDWAEHQAPDRNPNDNTPPRPRTVHGKKDTENRGPRGNGRRVQPGLHVRSQSVPALQDLAGSRPNIMNKFGTWGIGSKGVTEDWDDDFEFADFEPAAPSGPSNDEAVLEDLELPSVFVPKIIQAQQRNVLANISLLREWGLLIEELKELRMKVVGGGIKGDHVVELFDEADAMIELADQEAEDEVLPQQSSKASTPALDRELRDLSVSADTESVQDDSLAWDEDNIDDSFETKATTARSSVSPSSKGSPFVGNRPRKDSEAVARSVIQAIQKKRAPPEGLPDIRQHSTPVKKVPFDTATLKHIVPYVNGIVRRAKQILRDAEGLSSAPVTPEQPKEPALAQAFITPGSSPTTGSEKRLKRGFGPSKYESPFS